MISRQKLRGGVGRSSLGAGSRILACLILAVGLLALPQGAGADSQTWDKGAGTTDYNTQANWNLDTPIPGTGAGETASFSDVGGFTVNISAATANAVGFAFSHTTGMNYTITVANGVNQELTGVTAGIGGNNGWLELASAGTGTYTLNGTRTFSTIANQEITVSSVVADAGAAGGINANGAGTVILSGANTYTGGTTLTAGSLYVGNDNALGSGDLTINGGNFQAKAGTVVSVANNITVNSDFAIGGNSSLTLTGDVDLVGATRTITLNNTSDLTTLSGVISNGGLTTAGLQKLTLGGVNTYTGATTIGAGSTLALDATGTIADSSGVANSGTFTIAADKTIDSLTGAGATTLGGILTIGDATGTSGTYSGVASGAGGITKEGAGTLTLSGDNTYAGGTTLAAGTLGINSDTALGTGTLTAAGGSITAGGGATRTLTNAVTFTGNLTLNAGEDLTFSTGAVALGAANRTLTVTNAADSLTFGGVVSSTGDFGIIKAGAGTLTLSGANLYTGLTTITAGTLALDATGTIAASSGVANSGTFTIAADNTIDALTGAGATTLGGILTIGDATGTSGTYSGAASGAGGITTAGTGTLTLSGANPYTGLTTVSSGTLDLTGNITGGGGVTVLSPGTFNLTATGALTGDVNNSGTVALNGTQTGAFTNNADATLTGSGTITGALVNNGTVNPGNSPGTLTVGSYTVNPGATHVVEIASATSYDKVVVTGAGGVTLNGGTLSPRLLGGYLPTANQIFTNIISNTGGGLVTGTFGSVEDSQTLGWRAIYHADSVDLQAYQEFLGLPGSELSVSLSANQRSVANMLNALPPVTSGDLLEVLNAIHALNTADAVRAAYNDISPQKYAALPTLAFPVTHMQFHYLLNRLARQRWEAKLGSDAVSSGGGGFMRGFNFGYDNTRMLLASSSFTLSDAGNPLIRPEVGHRWGIYLEPMANWGNLSPSANMVGYRYKNFGFTLGADYWVTNNWLVGVNTGYSKTLTGIGGTGGDINANVIPFNAYTAFFLKGFYANGTLGYTYSNYDMERNVAYGTINRTAKANTSGNQFQAAAETGYDFKAGNAIVGPTVTLQYATQTTGGFTESNAGALNLRVDSQTAYSLQTGVGARASYRAKVGNVTVKPQVAVAWQHEFSNDTRGVNARLAQGSTTMNWRTDKIGQNFAVVSVDVPARISKNLVANVGYTAEVGRAKSSNQGINLGLRYEF